MNTMNSATLDFDSLVESFYEPLYRFAMSLSGRPEQAADLTQQTFYRALSRENQLRDKSKAKSWLFTILYREFLGGRRHRLRHPTQPIEESDPGQLVTENRLTDTIDSQVLVEKLSELDEHHRVPLILFYQEDYSYRQIAEFLGIPMGTVMSRLNRGKLLLRERLDSNFEKGFSRTGPAKNEHETSRRIPATPLVPEAEYLAVCA